MSPAPRPTGQSDHLDTLPTGRRLAEVLAFAIADDLTEGLARVAVALTERVVVLELERFATTTSPDRAIAGVRRLAARLAELADAIDGTGATELGRKAA